MTKNVINVLLIEGVNSQNEKVYHYILIKDPAHFLKKKYTSVTGSFSYSKNNCCRKCFSKFTSSYTLETHEKACLGGKKTVIVIPPRTYKIHFKKPWLGFPHLLTGYVDFESVLVKDEGFHCEKCISHEHTENISCEHKFSATLHNHKAVNYSFILIDRELNVVYERSYTGDDAVEDFWKLFYFSERKL